MQSKKEKLSDSMVSTLHYLNRKPYSIKGYYPESTGNRFSHAENSDWGEGRSPQALHALVRKGYMTEGRYEIPARYGYFELTQKALDWIEDNKEILDKWQSKQEKIQADKLKSWVEKEDELARAYQLLHHNNLCSPLTEDE